MAAPEREDEAVEAELLEPAETGAPGRDLPKVFEMRMGVSYLTSEKLLEALVVIFSTKIKL
jgi:hypothetical protein